MISEFLDVSTSPKTNIIYVWRPQDTPSNVIKKPNRFDQYYFGKSQDLGNRTFWKCWKRWVLGTHEDPFQKLLKSSNMGSISS